MKNIIIVLIGVIIVIIYKDAFFTIFSETTINQLTTTNLSLFVLTEEITKILGVLLVIKLYGKKSQIWLIGLMFGITEMIVKSNFGLTAIPPISMHLITGLILFKLCKQKNGLWKALITNFTIHWTYNYVILLLYLLTTKQ